MDKKEVELASAKARHAAVQFLYCSAFSGAKAGPGLMRRFLGTSFGEAAPQPPAINERLFSLVVKGVARNLDAIDGVVAPLLPRGLEGTDLLLACILRAGAFELMFRPSVPIPVAVSEYSAIAREFLPQKAAAVVGAVLSRVVRPLQSVIDK